MADRLIVIRGNSGSGKTTTANLLRHKMGYKTMLISQDVVRRDILRVRDTDNNESIRLMYLIAKYGRDLGYDVIIEGILSAKKYQKIIKDISCLFSKQFYYYFDLPFDETLKRHATKPNHDEFGQTEMAKWWREKDLLNFCEESIIKKDVSLEDCADMIIKDII